MEKFNSNNLHSSIIFYGEKGIGKKLFIYNFINEIFRLNFNNKNYSHHHNLLKNYTHPNVKILEKVIDPKSKKLKSYITVDQVRGLKKFMNESSSIKDLSKFIIIDSADDLNSNSSNSLLKSLEEPKKDTFIFLISHQLSNLLPTIRSRCLKIKLNNHEYNNFKIIMKNQISDIPEDEISFYYDLTNGSPGKSISIYDNNILEVIEKTLNSLVSNKIDENHSDLFNMLTNFDNEKFKSYLSILKTILVTLNKLKIENYESKSFFSNKFNIIDKLSKSLSKQNIIDRFEFLSNNEKDLFTYNLDKKLFMLRFLTQ